MATDYVYLAHNKLVAILAAGQTGTAQFPTQLGAGTKRLARFKTFTGEPQPKLMPGNEKPGGFPALFFTLDTAETAGPQLMPTMAEAAGKPTQTLATFKAKIAADESALRTIMAVARAVEYDLAAFIITEGRNDLGIDGCNAELLKTRFRPKRTDRDEDAGGHMRIVGELLIPVRLTYLPLS